MSVIPEPQFPLSVTDAVGLSDWYARYALDHLDSEPRRLNRGVRGHLTGSTVQLHATVVLLHPLNDEPAPGDPGDGGPTP